MSELWSLSEITLLESMVGGYIVEWPFSVVLALLLILNKVC